MAAVELDDATKAKLRAKVALLVSRGTPEDKAKRIVWDGYLAELVACSDAQPNAVPLPEVPIPEMPPSRPNLAPPGRWFWDAKDEPKLTPEWLERNRQQLAKVKRILRSK